MHWWCVWGRLLLHRGQDGGTCCGERLMVRDTISMRRVVGRWTEPGRLKLRRRSWQVSFDGWRDNVRRIGRRSLTVEGVGEWIL